MTKTMHIFSEEPNIYTKVFSLANVVQQQAGCDAKGTQGNRKETVYTIGGDKSALKVPLLAESTL